MPLALPVRPNSLTNLLTGLAASQHFELDIRLEANSTSLIGETIRASDLATISPAHVFFREIASGEFSAVRIVRPTIEQTTWMSVGSPRPLSAAAEIVTRLISKLALQRRAPIGPQPAEMDRPLALRPPVVRAAVLSRCAILDG
ncbi:MAG: hypothetical protein K2X57_11150 [Xanthobacteraceae bacterium]|nr:hypothetical protein [Xanthobacteraceae bacterium]